MLYLQHYSHVLNALFGFCLWQAKLKQLTLGFRSLMSTSNDASSSSSLQPFFNGMERIPSDEKRQKHINTYNTVKPALKTICI